MTGLHDLHASPVVADSGHEHEAAHLLDGSCPVCGREAERSAPPLPTTRLPRWLFLFVGLAVGSLGAIGAARLGSHTSAIEHLPVPTIGVAGAPGVATASDQAGTTAAPAAGPSTLAPLVPATPPPPTTVAAPAPATTVAPPTTPVQPASTPAGANVAVTITTTTTTTTTVPPSTAPAPATAAPTTKAAGTP